MMASLLKMGPASSAVRKQIATPLCISPQSMASVQARSSSSAFCQARLQASHRPQSSSPILPVQQSRTFLTQLRRQAQALKEQTVAPSTRAPPVQPIKAPSPPLRLTNLPYFIRRTASNQLPVYVDTKAGGSKQLTKIQKTEGDLPALCSDLAIALGGVYGTKSTADVTLNRLTGHVIVKGWRKPEIVNFLKERGF